MSTPKAGKPAPRYIQVADTLQDAIRAGDYPVGSLLPSEMELCQQFEASRHTIREALRRLSERGLVTRRRGTGTLVVSSAIRVKYNQYVGSLGDLMQYGAETRFEVLRSAHVAADDELAALLDCKSGEECLHLHGIRYQREFSRPVCTTEVYRCARDRVAEQLQDLHAAVFVLTKELNIERIGRVEQTLTAVNISAREAAELGIDPGTAGLKTIRRYFDRGDSLLLAAVSLHPGSVFSYTTTLVRAEST